MNPKRAQLLQELAANRQPDVKVVLENVRDLHNVGAVMRTCDAVGVPEVHMTLLQGFKKSKLRMGKQTSAGARKWVDTILHPSIDACLDSFDTTHVQILGTALSDDAQSIYEVDMTIPTIIVFGNERNGLSQEALHRLDQQIMIPQKGMVQSLNISVACAVTLYEMMRQRMVKGYYGREQLLPGQADLLEKYKQTHNYKFPGEVDIRTS